MSSAIRAGMFGGGTISAVAVAIFFLTAQGHAQSREEAATPFRSLAGSWTGGGTVTLSSGAKERIRCRAQYQVASSGDALRQHLRCASASYNFDLSSDVKAQGGTLSGQWTESTRNTGGTVSGSVLSGGRIQAVVNGPGFSAALSLTTRGNQQSVRITSRGEQLTEVTITLSRG